MNTTSKFEYGISKWTPYHTFDVLTFKLLFLIQMITVLEQSALTKQTTDSVIIREGASSSESSCPPVPCEGYIAIQSNFV